MNRENLSEITAKKSSSNHPTYYALAASTAGDNVTIYRYALDRINSEYYKHIYNIIDPVQQAVAKYKWAEFILENLPHYSADRSELFRAAQAMCINAFYNIQADRYNTKKELQEAVHQLTELQKRKFIPGCVTPHRLNQAIRRVKSCRKRFDSVMEGCSDEIFEKMRRRTEEFEYFW